jgi:shikimate kinase
MSATSALKNGLKVRARYNVTLKDIKNIDKEISRLNSKVAKLESGVTSTAPNMSGLPSSNDVSDKVGNAVAEIADIKREIQNLEILRNSALNRLSNDILVENCLFMRLSLKYSWAKIAMTLNGVYTPDYIRLKCHHYKW